MNKNNLKMFLVFNIIAFEQVSRNSNSPEGYTCHCQSICYQATLRVNISLREIFSKSGFLRVMKKQDESGHMHIFQEFKTVSHVDCQRMFCNGVF